jgi:hypothetical protein
VDVLLCRVYDVKMNFIPEKLLLHYRNKTSPFQPGSLANFSVAFRSFSSPLTIEYAFFRASGFGRSWARVEDALIPPPKSLNHFRQIQYIKGSVVQSILNPIDLLEKLNQQKVELRSDTQGYFRGTRLRGVTAAWKEAS